MRNVNSTNSYASLIAATPGKNTGGNQYPAPQDAMDKNTQKLIDDIEAEVHFTRHIIGKDQLDPRVMAVMASIPREQFIPSRLKYLAYSNQPVPIDYGQTISQPYIVALMTDLLAIQPQHRLLEIGTGSGYQTAVLSRLCAAVYSVELIAALNKRALKHFKKLNYRNITTCIGNGYNGWPEHAPYDGIIVTAAASHIPQALLDQLKPGGRLVIPVEMPDMYQQLLLVEKDSADAFRTTRLIGVSFVPLVDDAVLPNTEKNMVPKNECIHAHQRNALNCISDAG